MFAQSTAAEVVGWARVRCSYGIKSQPLISPRRPVPRTSGADALTRTSVWRKATVLSLASTQQKMSTARQFSRGETEDFASDLDESRELCEVELHPTEPTNAAETLNVDPVFTASMGDSPARRDMRPLGGATDSLLWRYFRDISKHPVMGPDEELESAQAVAQAETEHWVALLSYLPVAASVLDRLEQDIAKVKKANRPTMRQLNQLRTLLQAYREQHSTLKAEQQRQWNEVSAELARTVRLRDPAWVINAYRAATEITRPEVGDTRQQETAQTSAHRRYVERIRGTDRRQRDAKNRLVNANLRLVVTVAHRCVRGLLPLMDLIQEGNIGLIKAVERFDYARGSRFSTYASWWIFSEISRAVESKGRTVRVPTHMHAARSRVSRASQAIITRTGREPTLDELAQATGLRKEKLVKVCELCTALPCSLSPPADDDRGLSFVDSLLENEQDALTPFDYLASQRWAEEVQKLLCSLTPVEKRVIRWRFGWDEELTLKQIGTKCDLTGERVRNIQNEAVDKIRNRMRRGWL